MGKYAANTNVSSELSRLEIEKTLIRYGADNFAYATSSGKALKGREIKLKYNATLVTVEEYSNRLNRADEMLESEKRKTERAFSELSAAKDEVNSYKIQLNNVALKEENIKHETAVLLRNKIVNAIESHKGNISKSIACDIVESVLASELEIKI